MGVLRGGCTQHWLYLNYINLKRVIFVAGTLQAGASPGQGMADAVSTSSFHPPLCFLPMLVHLKESNLLATES